MMTSSLFVNKNIVRQCFRCMSTMKKQSSAEYCLELVRKRDYENFLCTLLLPNNIKAAGFAIRAFNVEIAQVEDQISIKHIGIMRLQFWKETLNRIYDGMPSETPVALELHRILQKHKLSKRYFKRLIDARLDKLEKSTFPNIQAVENYAESTVSSIYYLLLEAHGTKNIKADHAASHLGKAQGIVTLLRSIPYHAQKRVIVLPEDILMKHNISSESVLRNVKNTALNDVIFEVASCAKQHVEEAISLNTLQESKSIFLPIICIENYLEELRKTDFDIFHPRLVRRNGFLPLQLLWRKITDKFSK
ncbi:NADH dehydrogenase (ubiquinone) complex I, assembly factor 6 [Vespa velutina]|uniref:NADH dehydrogenase (ubiquinone) complex I, assembly factor 6 n=1 Tax=Vespa velutina TaxID=202808 RepID=UPI001F000C09|nr:NADH dehydrogenase (ubiquinone) complex I, assembly factor 6 isoform X1 [Vespa crabro]XP_046832003.1 NADH dehydrogenase (ubiquinone) complex I, assembly factor 6 isoform X1 [Vespa crabro]XP_046832004.1 NADH dehydrogenase (ubiquinone) complex I, assembly factor 6 isoform X1 [Vespa crabro]XP_047364557.1 NADH dehydrogenase (ubiquinone) complex I, assembly factor 6 [Vespa velutina]